MINIIKKEIKISKELLSKIELACAFNKTTSQNSVYGIIPKFIGG